MDDTRKEKVFSKRVGRNVFEAAPRISVVIPVYNVADYISETLESVFAQKYREHEIIIVNDGSPDTDQLERAIRTRLEDIVYIKQRNAGAGPARNLAIEHARGDVIAFLDGDDLWNPEFLASQFVFMQRNDYDLVYCDAQLFGTRSAYKRNYMQDAPSVGEANFDSLLATRCNVITSGTLVRKQAIIDAGMFETERVRAHDFHLWLRIAKNGGRIGYQTKQLLKYRVRVDSLSGDSIARVERELDVFERVRNSIKLTPEQNQIVADRIALLEADLAVEQGKAFLLKGQYREASLAFRVANRYRKSLKLAAVALLSRIAPRTLVKYYRSNRSADIAFVPTAGQASLLSGRK